MTPDEVIAANLRRLREDRDLSVIQLGERLRVDRHTVYDMERPRSGRTQRSFAWSELVALCAVLECSIFELVLPDEGETVDVPEWFPMHIESVEVPGAIGAVRTSFGREELTRLVFHLPTEALDRLPEIEQRLVKAAREAERNLRARIWDELRAALEQEGDGE